MEMEDVSDTENVTVAENPSKKAVNVNTDIKERWEEVRFDINFVGHKILPFYSVY